MSHFTVMVSANDKDELDAKLLPFHEYECTGIEQYIEWVDDIHDENKERYDNDTVECVFRGDKLIGTKYSDKPEIKRMWRRDGIGISSRDELILPPVGYELREVPFTEVYETFDDFMRDWCGYNPDKYKDKETGRYGRWTNPNAQWDWYGVGGRWTGKLMLREPSELAGNGEPGLMTERNADKLRADYSPVRLVDFEAMRNEKREREIERHRKIHELYAASERDNVIMPMDDEEREENQRRYDDLVGRGVGFEVAYPTFEDYLRRNVFVNDTEHVIPLNVDEILRYDLPEDEFIKTIDDSVTWAFIDSSGCWQEKADMGWFGMSSKEERHAGYGERFWSWIESLDSDDVVWVVDCHI